MPLFFRFDHFLDARAEIRDFFFRGILWHQNFHSEISWPLKVWQKDSQIMTSKHQIAMLQKEATSTAFWPRSYPTILLTPSIQKLLGVGGSGLVNIGNRVQSRFEFQVGHPNYSFYEILPKLSRKLSTIANTYQFSKSYFCLQIFSWNLLLP